MKCPHSSQWHSSNFAKYPKCLELWRASTFFSGCKIHQILQGKLKKNVKNIEESLFLTCKWVTCSRVLNSPPSLKKKCAEPSVLSLVKLKMLPGLICNCCVPCHHIIIHDCLCSKHRKTSRTTENTSQNMLSCLLQPMTNSILKLLVPYLKYITSYVISWIKIKLNQYTHYG